MQKTVQQLSQKTWTTMLDRSRDDDGVLCAASDKHLNLQGLINVGLLRPTAFAVTYDCDCGGLSDITWAVNSRDGTRTPYFCCDECGVNRLDPEDIRCWEIVISTLVQRIGEAMGFEHPFEDVVSKSVWLLGRKKRREFYYVRSTLCTEERILRAFFELHPTAVLIVPSNFTRKQINDLLPNHICFSMEAIGSLDESCRISVDMTSIETEVEPVASETKRQRSRVIKIDQLVTELKKHYQDAKDYYYTSGGEVLPRPTQKDLAKRIGTSQDVVSRCIKDEKSFVLRTLWDNAENLNAILNQH